jgi:hypothetical protein
MAHMHDPEHDRPLLLASAEFEALVDLARHRPCGGVLVLVHGLFAKLGLRESSSAAQRGIGGARDNVTVVSDIPGVCCARSAKRKRDRDSERLDINI